MHAGMCARSLKLCPTLCKPDRSPPGSPVHGILQARILGWVSMPFSRGSSGPRIKPISLLSPASQAGSLALVPPGKPCVWMGGGFLILGGYWGTRSWKKPVPRFGLVHYGHRECSINECALKVVFELGPGSFPRKIIHMQTTWCLLVPPAVLRVLVLWFVFLRSLTHTDLLLPLSLPPSSWPLTHQWRLGPQASALGCFGAKGEEAAPGGARLSQCFSGSKVSP